MIFPVSNEGYSLFLEGQVALSQVEHNGMKIDTDYLDNKILETEARIEKLAEGLKKDKDCRKVYKTWKRRYGVSTNLGSREQLGTILFDVFKIKGGAATRGGRWKADKDALEDIDLPFIHKFLEVEKLKKANTTYLKGIKREVDSNGFLHPSYNLNLVATFRSSADSPNVQTMPIRDEDMSSLIRPCFIPRHSKWRFTERDFSGIEVRTCACNCKDPNLIKYIYDKTSDMHRDLAQQLFMLDADDVSKKARYAAKNGFTFPEFYGDFWASCAKNLWSKIIRMEITTEKGIPLLDHLKTKGIKTLGEFQPSMDPKKGTFMQHVKQVEDDFWKRRFKIYGQWKWDIWNQYVAQGYLDTLSGFRCSAIMDKKQASNYGPQGDAAHCLLWCLIRVQKLLKKYKLRACITGQIHDSLLADVHQNDLKAYAEITEKVMSHDIRKHWDWIIVPLESELEAAPAGKSWYEKKKVEF